MCTTSLAKVNAVVIVAVIELEGVMMIAVIIVQTSPF